MPLREPLPSIKVPLRPTDADAVIDLQSLLAKAYRNGAYDDIDYTRPPIPPLARPTPRGRPSCWPAGRPDRGHAGLGNPSWVNRPSTSTVWPSIVDPPAWRRSTTMSQCRPLSLALPVSG